MKAYFFDTYALFEVVYGNPRYQEFLRSVVITTRLQLMELHYWLLLRHNQQVADEAYNRFAEYAIAIPEETYRQASMMKARHKKKRLFYVDCLGYVLARKNKVLFLTGDQAFRNMDEVKFVK